MLQLSVGAIFIESAAQLCTVYCMIESEKLKLIQAKRTFYPHCIRTVHNKPHCHFTSYPKLLLSLNLHHPQNLLYL